MLIDVKDIGRKQQEIGNTYLTVNTDTEQKIDMASDQKSAAISLDLSQNINLDIMCY